MPDIEVVDPGSKDDPFTQDSGDPSSARSAAVSDKGQVEDDETEDTEDADADEESDAEADESDDDDDGLTEDEQLALEELQNYLQEQATARVEKEVVPRLQSTYDRQIAAHQRKIQELETRQAKREQELLAQVREAQLNGLTDEERARLKDQWSYEDRLAELDARERELTGYHNELQKAQIVADYGQFGVELEDLDEFETPEEMELFAKEVELEYYRLLSKQGFSVKDEDDEDEEDEDERPRSKSKPKAKARVPAGAAAPSDGGGGRAVPEAGKFNTGKGIDSMTENLKGLGWDNVTLSS